VELKRGKTPLNQPVFSVTKKMTSTKLAPRGKSDTAAYIHKALAKI
jgi:hypothetical protein